MMYNIAEILSGPQILIVLAIILLLFGAGRIPELMRNLGSGMKEFKKGLNTEEEDPKAVKGSTDKKE